MTTARSLADVTPETPIRLEGMHELAAFEDVVADHIDAQMMALNLEGYTHAPLDRNAWSGRIAIKDVLRVPKFNGLLRNVRLARMDDGYEQLSTVHERGLTCVPKFQARRGDDDEAPLTAPIFQGFVFTADASSSTGWSGQMQSELYYYPATILLNGTRLRQNIDPNGGSNIRRTITKPQLVQGEEYLHYYEKSKEVGLELLVKGLRNVRPATMRN